MAQWPNEQTIGISDPSFAPSSDLRLSLGSPAVLHWSPLTAHTGICLVMLMMMMLMMMPGWTLNGSIRQLNTVRERASNKGLAPLLPPIDNAIKKGMDRSILVRTPFFRCTDHLYNQTAIHRKVGRPSAVAQTKQCCNSAHCVSVEKPDVLWIGCEEIVGLFVGRLIRPRVSVHSNRTTQKTHPSLFM
ncbi:predicted protein [Plenodomus lingam JN3]|uniref:Predicted protein n=1 Tax=Leptosphaeria maculans (strain JN3 / isolate v23.1.3 / race Av1-4-5-6-7-8) TaxID=985895 RepID=E5ACN7_LEPMJ|nr:predicted protein [Plenodomus lingam JN3]CBY02239.1 predicted protein [Plenodomus lingam JN3]